MKAIEVKQSIISGLLDFNIEIFAQGLQAFFTQNGHVKPISNLPAKVRAHFRKEMYENKDASLVLFTWCDGIETDMIEQYIFCNYGGFDTTPDYDAITDTSNKEVWNCPMRGKCSAEGVVCGKLTENSLTQTEMKVLKHMVRHSQKPFKQIASELNMANNTFSQHSQHIYRKLGCNSKTEVVTRYAALI